jgi:sugar lactone lactonase YvrE
MKRHLPVLHFLFLFLASALLTGCETTTGVATQDSGESAKVAKVSTIAGGELGFADGIGGAAMFLGPSGIASDAAGNLYVADTVNDRIRKITPAGEVSTIAGGELGFADDIGNDAKFNRPYGIARDAAGNLYVTDYRNHRIRKITPTGEVSTLAGSEEGFADGVGSDARFNKPRGIAADAAGNLYVADFGNDRIRKITPAGEVSTFAGGEEGFADGVGSDARFASPSGISSDAAGKLYVSDWGNHRIRKITPAGEVSTLAGGEEGFADGVGSDARFNGPNGIAIDAAGNLYVADAGNHRIREITPAGEVSTLADSEYGFADGIGGDAKFHYPVGIASDAVGNLYVTDSGSSRIRKITLAGEVSTFTGGKYGFRRAAFRDPTGIAIDAAGNLYVADTENHRIRKITPAGEVSTIAGGEEGFADGVGSDARFNKPRGIAADAAGNLYVADFGNDRIRKITPAGEVSTLAGGERGFADGVGSDARFDHPFGIASDAAGNLYVADSRNHRIRKITPAGEVSTLANSFGRDAIFISPSGIAIDAAGNLYVTSISCIDKITPSGEVSTLAGAGGGFADGIGSDARFRYPKGIASDVAGNLYVADSGNHRIRKLVFVTDPVMVSTLAGGEKDFADGVGSDAKFRGPVDIAINAAGYLYVADFGNHRIRKISPAGEVSTLAGGGLGFADGIGSDAEFDSPSGIASDAAGNLYVADFGNHRIRKITPAGEVSTLAGGEEGFADGVGSDARFRRPLGIEIDAAGNLYVADFGNNRIRKITLSGEVSTLAGGESGFADGIGSDARFSGPSGIETDAAGNLYVADIGNNHIRKITPAGEVSTLAGGEKGFTDGIGNAARFYRPAGIASDAAGDLYVADTFNNRIRKITPAGEVSTLAGGGYGFADGIGSDARFSTPRGIAVDAAGNLYVADFWNHRIRKIEIRRP